jgi:alanine racemase
MIELPMLLESTGGRLDGPPAPTRWADWCYDSRLARSGQIFVAIKTERRDGHAFILDAVKGGCTGVLCERSPGPLPGVTVVVVRDARLALQAWAAAVVRRYEPAVIGVTGTVGKTSTKRAIATLLDGLGPVFRSRRSFNSLFGLPVALGTLAPEHRFAVLEMGVDRFGEMARLAQLFPPRVAVVTNVAPAHLQYLRDEAHIAAEKSELVAALPPDGWAVLNADDERVRAMAARSRAPIIWYSAAERLAELPRSGDLLAAAQVEVGLEGTRFTLRWRAEAQCCAFPLIGRHSVYIALAAVGAALACGMSFAQATARLGLVERQAGRLQPLPGLNGATLLDDTYNASPRSALAALDALADLPARRRIAVLGDMLELGDAAAALHRDIGRRAAEVADLVVTKGDLGAEIAAGARAARPEGQAPVVTHTAGDAIAAVRGAIGPGDLVLLKGSAAARMEVVARGLLAPGLDPAQLLVRQEAAFEVLRIGAPDRPTWLEIDLQAIGGNVEALRRIAGPRVAIMAVLKADAYGHGAVRVARTVLRHGADALAVATIGEAAALRDAGITAPILALGYTPPWQVREALRRDVQITIFDGEVARECAAAAAELALPARVHVKVDTGMARLGLKPEDAPAFLAELNALEGVEVVGLFTHFATADAADETFAREQLRRFNAVVDAVTHAGLRPRLVHAANSAATFRFPEARFDMVRPGIAVYGLDPAPETPCPTGFRAALAFKTAIAQVKTLPPGSPVSYGATYITRGVERIATIPVGYADGFRRQPHWRDVLVHGRRVPVVGRVCMDYTMLDVTQSPGVAVGDEVALIGRQGDDQISAEEVAGWLGTSNYEVVAAILPRVPRLV